MVHRRPIVITAIFFTFLLISSEIYLRYAGYGSYPIYDVDNDIRYIPAANQHGRFRNLYTWFFNNRHMGNILNWSPEIHPNLLLIGNSIVLGGNTFTPEDKLGPLLAKDLGGRSTVWSVAAGGWTNVNVMTYLDRNADVLHNADAVIIEYAENHLIAPAAWPGYYIYPDHKPWILTGYIFSRAVRRRLAGAGFLHFESPPTGMPDAAQLQRFKELVTSLAKQHKIVIFNYPRLKNLQNKSAWLEVVAPIESLCRTTMAKCVDIAQAPAWNERAYTSDGIHPTVEGNKILASILANAIN
ncbi:MAG: SGNH/GDSL hydrolase family protein [Methylocella sp.]